jgi:DNA-binding NarL/FixJ family response regulator
MPVRIILADDHTLMRAGIRALLENIADVEVIAEASDGAQVLELLKNQPPDILLTDIAMPGMNGLETAARVTKEFPGVRVIILSMHANEEYVCRAMQAGAAGYLLKDADPGELERALRAVAAGESYLTPAISKHVISDYLRRVSGEKIASEPLTPRQREILQLIAEGKSTKEMARILQISAKTVETHRAQLMERLEIHDIAGLVRYAIRNGLVKLDA